jgi:hypothetical protein
MNPHFITKPADILFSPVPNSTDWIIRMDTGYYSAILDKVIVVGKNFITDLASVPRPLWWIYPPSGKYDLAVVLHDWLFWNQLCTFEQANRVLQEAMIVCGCSKFDADAFYHAVGFSKGVYRKYGKMSDAERETGFAKIIDGQIIIEK